MSKTLAERFGYYGTIFSNRSKKGKYIGNWDNPVIHDMIKTVVLNSEGVVVADYIDKMNIQHDQTVMLQIRQYHVIHKSYKGKTYILFYTAPFTFSPDGGITVWNSHIDEAFDTAEGMKQYRYVGILPSTEGRSVPYSGSTVSKTRTQFRDQHTSYGEGFTQLDYYTYQMLHRLVRTEVRMLMPDVIPTWRGLQLKSDLWCEFLDGINIHDSKVYLAKPKSKFSDDTSDEPYRYIGLKVLSENGKITSYHDGTFLPKRVVDDGLIRNYWHMGGWRVVLVGTQLFYSAIGGPSAFHAAHSSAVLNSSFGSRGTY